MNHFGENPKNQQPDKIDYLIFKSSNDSHQNTNYRVIISTPKHPQKPLEFSIKIARSQFPNNHTHTDRQLYTHKTISVAENFMEILTIKRCIVHMLLFLVGFMSFTLYRMAYVCMCFLCHSVPLCSCFWTLVKLSVVFTLTILFRKLSTHSSIHDILLCLSSFE